MDTVDANVSLLVRLWVEILCGRIWNRRCCQPPCEAVSWNECDAKEGCLAKCQPPCEAVSWNISPDKAIRLINCQPPCEAVSWNDSIANGISSISVSLLVRLWVEMSSICLFSSAISVSLLVRLWVEIPFLRWHPWKNLVSLLVRLWVEMHRSSDRYIYSLQSASLWGCELKCNNIINSQNLLGQPPCEAVSWNTRTTASAAQRLVSLLVRLWVEISWWSKC